MSRCLLSHADWPLCQVSFLSVASFSVESLAVANLATASLLAAVNFAGCSGFLPLGPSLLGFALAAPLSDFFRIAIFVTLIVARTWARDVFWDLDRLGL